MKGEKEMITKEQNINKYCCLYVSDYHLEMILLPFIKNKKQNSEVLIFTQNDLSDSIKVLLEKTNLSAESKNNILNIKNWNNKNIDEISKSDKVYTIIINGEEEYINTINKKIEGLKINVINIVDCYDLNECRIKSYEIRNKYKGILNTESID